MSQRYPRETFKYLLASASPSVKRFPLFPRSERGEVGTMAVATSQHGAAGEWWLFGLLPFLASSTSFCCCAMALLGTVALVTALRALAAWACPGGSAWGAIKGRKTIPGPRGWPVLGILFDMGGLAHRRLARFAEEHGAKSLMAFSLGNTRLVITSHPEVARELLNSSAFANRPLKQSAQQLLFGRAIGFAPYGDYWRNLRRIASNHLFSPKRNATHEPIRQFETTQMLEAIATHAAANGGAVLIRQFLQQASLNNIMSTVFGRRYALGDSQCKEAVDLQLMVQEGFELLGAFNWADHLPALESMDPQHILDRCSKLVPRVKKFVQNIIDEHRQQQQHHKQDRREASDFVDVLLSLEDQDKLHDEDMIAVLWEMIFRGTDTTALFTEWMLAELVLNKHIQCRIHDELDAVVGRSRDVLEADVPKLVYLQAVVKETFRLHPPGPLLSWARLATEDVQLAGHHIPAGTTAMVNMWSITHDSSIWPESSKFKPERFIEEYGGSDVDIKGNDLRLAPFGAGRRVCPGRALALATVHLWLARLLHHFEWMNEELVNLTEVLKLSSEMASPLRARVVKRELEFSARMHG